MYQTPQEAFWAGEFGNEYIDRSQGLAPIILYMFAHILDRTDNVESMLEFGANIGNNLQAIHTFMPQTAIDAVEINEKAVRALKEHSFMRNIYHSSIIDFEISLQYDLVMTSGLLIHISPSHLPLAYDKMYNASKKFILMIEYYNPTPMEVPYRNHTNVLFKRDFPGELMDRHPGVTLVDYGFIYNRTANFSGEDNFWFLMRKP